MMLKTHIVVALLIALSILSLIQNKILFVILFFVATIIPDIDSPNSFISRKTKASPSAETPEFSTFKHRGMFHSFTFCLAVSIPFLFFLPQAAFPIFLGYSTHILIDALTMQGIMVWWPSKKITNGPLKTNGIIENILFFAIAIICIIMIFPPFSILANIFK